MMKRPFLLFLPFLLFIAGAFVACEEVEEPGIYANWQQRNEAFIDSIKAATGDNIVAATVEAADAMELGKLYAIQVPPLSTGSNPQYIYCKKLVKNLDGVRPLFAGSDTKVSAYYYGTLITGDRFDGNFEGYGALDQVIPLPLPKDKKWPTDFDSPSSFTINGNLKVEAWNWALQYMRVGERIILYTPWQSGYGASGSSDGGIPGYTTMTFDIILDGVE